MSAETAFKKCTCVFFSLLRTKREKKIHIKTDFFSVNHKNCTYMQHYYNDIFVRFGQLFKNWQYILKPPQISYLEHTKKSFMDVVKYIALIISVEIKCSEEQ